jgi:amino acid adenylation domain-containing protein
MMEKKSTKIKDLKGLGLKTQQVRENLVEPCRDFIPFEKEEIEQSIPERFEATAEKYPDKIAVKVGPGSITYDALNSRANQVAHGVLASYDDRYRLSRSEKKRYSRQLKLHQWGIESQEKLKSTTVFVGGAGGSGSPLIMQLALTGIGTIIICDHDQVELSNLNRQVLHDESRIGMNKALSAQMTVKRINPHVNVIACTEKITADNVEDLVGNASIIFDNVDDIETKFVLSRCAVHFNIPHILSSMIDMDAYAAVLHPPQGPCFHCLYDVNILQEIEAIKKIRDTQKNRYETFSNPVASPSLFLSTGFAVNEAIKILLGFDKPSYNKYFLFDQRGLKNIFQTMGYHQIVYPFSQHFKAACKKQGFNWDEGREEGFVKELTVEPDPRCPVCGENSQLTRHSRQELRGVSPGVPSPGTHSQEAYLPGAPGSGNPSEAGEHRTAALLFGHDIDMIAGILGVLKAGLAYVPLDVSYPVDRLQNMLEDSEARMIITNHKNLQLARKVRDQVNKNIVALNIDEIPAHAPAGNPHTAINPKTLAYILYTSGSTGKPKGVMQNHRNVLHFARVYTNALHINDQDRLTLFSSYSFDAAKMDIYGALLNGAALYPYDIKAEGHLERLPQWLREQCITIYHSIPTIYRYFTDLVAETPQEDRFPLLRFIVLGGEAVFKKDVENYKNYFSQQCLFINGLGPTESTVTLQYFVDKKTEIPREAIPVGYPVEDTRVLLLNERNQEAGTLGGGEIAFKSDYLALGYWKNPGQTQQAFTPDPLTGEGRVYRTGDLGRRLPDGSIEYAGRKDLQMKISGYRIEPGEIESRLDQVTGIKKSIVVSSQDDSGDNFLTAYYTQTNGGQVDENHLVKILKNSLPDYMIPSVFIGLPGFPLTQTGKIDRKKLSQLDMSEILPRGELEAPGNESESHLLKLWKEVLKQDDIGVNRNFFLLGGNSIKAILLVSRVHKEMKVKISLADIFQRPTIKELAAVIDRTQKRIYQAITPVEKKEYYPLSSAQERLFFLNWFEEESTRFNIFVALSISGPLEIRWYQFILEALIQRHESLRTSFTTVNDTPVQRVHDQVKFEIEYHNVSEVEVKEEEQKTEDRGQKTENRGQKTEDRGQKTEDRGQKTEDRGQKTEDRGQKTENRRDPYLSSVIRHLSSGFIRPYNLASAPLIRVGVFSFSPKEHYLLFDVHHIIFDGTSMQILVNDFIRMVQKEKASPLAVQYKDFARWQKNLFQTGMIEKQEDYWLSLYADGIEGKIPRVNLPTDFPRPDIMSYEGDNYRFVLDKEKSGQLKKMAQAENISLFILLLSMYNVFLSKLSRQEDIIVASVTAGRDHPDIENVLGVFINMLSLRNFPRKEKPFAEFLAEVGKSTLQAFENRDYPFEDLVEMLPGSRDVSRHPLADVGFTLQNIEIIQDKSYHSGESQLRLVSLKSERKNARNDLNLEGFEINQQVELEFQYRTKLFKKQTIIRFAGYFENLLTKILENPQQKIGDIQLITDQEKELLLFTFNNTTREYPENKTVFQWFEHQVERNPENIAIVSTIQLQNIYDRLEPEDVAVEVSYEELNERANQLAHMLRQKGIGPDTIVGLMVGHPIEKAIGIWGIMKSGGAYLPIDPLYPHAVIKDILKDSQVRMLVTETALEDILTGIEPARSVSIMFIDEMEADYDIVNPRFINNPSDLAYIIYTSGTTGKAKGTAIEHQGIVNYARWRLDYFNFTGEDAALQPLTYSFDSFCANFYPAFLSGGKLVMVPDNRRLDFAYIVELIKEHRVTNVCFAPGLYNALLDAAQEEDLKSFRLVVLAGEAGSPALIKKSREKAPHIWLANEYGPTEATVAATAYPTIEKTVTGIIGTPIANARIYILDESLQPVIPGAAGEICISGTGIARGYLNKPELTFEKLCLRRPGALFEKTAPGPCKNFLLNHSPLTTHHSPLYKTGDLGRWLIDENNQGKIEFLGRIDHQVKIRGHRIELEQIESVLMKHHNIKEVLVMVKGEADNKYICAYVIPRVPVDFSSTGIKDFLEERLPYYMVPSHIVCMETFPLTSNGKIDRKALPDPEVTAGDQYVAPRNKMEEKLVQIWAEVLNLEPGVISIEANFFDLGGHSLRATMLISRLQNELDLKVHLNDFFNSPSIRKLARVLETPTAVPAPKFTIDCAAKKDYYAVSSVQKRLYLLQQMDPQNTGYNNIQPVLIEGTPDKEKLTATFKKLIKHHESLRTSFDMIKGEPMQRIHEDVPFEIEYFEPGALEIEALMEDLRKPFDLARAPLSRVMLGKIQEEKFLLMLETHHIISDIISFGIFVRDFTTLYAGRELPRLKLRYIDFSEWQNSLNAKEILKQQEAYWLKEFHREIPLLNLPVDYPRPEKRNFAGNSINFIFTEEESDALKKLARTGDVTLFILLLAIFNVFLSKICSQEEIVVGTPIAARMHPDLHNIIGMFANTLALSNFPNAGKTFHDFLADVKKQTLEAYENQEFPFEQLVKQVVINRIPGRNPLFDVMFNFRGIDTIEETSASIIPGLKLAVQDYEANKSKFDLTLYARDNGDRLHFSFAYSTQLFEKETIENFTGYFRRIMDKVLENTSQKIEHIEIMEKEKIKAMSTLFSEDLENE